MKWQKSNGRSNTFSNLSREHSLRPRTSNPNGIKGLQDLDQMDGTNARIRLPWYLLLSSIHILYMRLDEKQIPDGFSHSQCYTYESCSLEWYLYMHVHLWKKRDHGKTEKIHRNNAWNTAVRVDLIGKDVQVVQYNGILLCIFQSYLYISKFYKVFVIPCFFCFKSGTI